MKTATFLACSLLFAGGVLRPAAVEASSILYESASLGPVGETVGYLAGLDYFIGVRFDVTAPVTTATVGGHLVEFEGGTLFAALIALTSENDFPDSPDLTSADVLGSTIFTAPFPSAEIATPLVVTLMPGRYALMFGGVGGFGATGRGGMPLNNTDLGTPSYFFRADNGAYFNNGFAHVRFVVTADPAVPEPASMLLLGTGLIGAGVRRYRLRRSRD